MLVFDDMSAPISTSFSLMCNDEFVTKYSTLSGVPDALTVVSVSLPGLDPNVLFAMSTAVALFTSRVRRSIIFTAESSISREIRRLLNAFIV